MRWKGRRVSKNVEDWTDKKFYKDPMINNADITGPMTIPKNNKSRLPDEVKLPPSRPRNQVTPGKWTTKNKI